MTSGIGVFELPHQCFFMIEMLERVFREVVKQKGENYSISAFAHGNAKTVKHVQELLVIVIDNADASLQMRNANS
jgi:hypothetical protein